MKPREIFCLLGTLLLISPFARAQQWDWVQRFSSESTGTAIGVDGEQNVYVAGTFTGTNFLGTNRFATTNGSAVFLVKLNPDGEVVWSLTLEGSLTHLAVATNGALFVVGNFGISESLLADSITNRSDVGYVFIARIDDGKFTWFDTLSPDLGGYAGGIAFAPDESVWVLGASNRVFFIKYDQSGAVLESFAMGDVIFHPQGLAVNREEHLFVRGFTANNLQFGFNSIDYRRYFVAGVNQLGQGEWAWSPGYSYIPNSGPNPINAIACDSEGNLVSAGAYQSAFKTIADVVKFSATGAIIARTGRSGYPSSKSIFRADGMALDSRGNVYVTGLTVGYYLASLPGDGLWLATYDSNGTLVSESRIGNRRFSYPWNEGHAIAATPDGTIYITGKLTHTAIFGTNEVGGSPAAFVARRSTLDPELVRERVGDNIVFSWPRAAFPFGLQQSDETGTNWLFVTNAPARVGVRWQVTLPAELAMGMFRLFRTNEAPIRHVPELIVAWGPNAVFLKHTNVVFAGASIYFAAAYREKDNEPLAFEWTFSGTGQGIAGVTNVAHYPPNVYNNVSYPLNEVASLISASNAFHVGQNTIQVIASDGIFSATNYWTFEVLTWQVAVGEFYRALEPLRATRAGRKALVYLESHRSALRQGRDALAERRWASFQQQLQRVRSLSDDERASLSSAAEQIKPLLRDAG
jgi:hypothetical protein